MRIFFTLAIIFLVCPGLVLAQTSFDLSELNKFTGETTGDEVGLGVAIIGDINGDGYDDFLAGSNLNDDVGDNAGAAYLVYGQEEEFTGTISLSTAVEFTGESSGDRAGYRVAGAGDVDGDGYDDFLVGSYGNDDAGGSAGAAYLVYGQEEEFIGTISLSTAVEFTGEAAGDSAGTSVFGAGDVDNDGYDDFLVSAIYNTDAGVDAGAVYLVYGQDSKYIGTISLSTAVEFTGEAAGDNAGENIANAGDVDGDGYDDFLVGSYGNDDAGGSAGAAYLVYGQEEEFIGTISLSTAVEFTGEAAGDNAGFGVTGAGDIDNDGYNDFLIGALGNDDAGGNAGAAYLVYGQSSKYTGVISLSTVIEFTGEAIGDSAGSGVSGAGDIDNDGYDDFLVGAYGNDDAGSNTGAAYLVYGQSSKYTGAISLSTAVKFTGEEEDDRVGSNLSGGGDFNNDGYDDFLIGVNGNDEAGAAYIGYLYVDSDGDGVTATTGLIAGTDCNDSDAAISTNRTYYLDSDGDGYGSDATTSVCSLTAPTGYVTNSDDTNDNDYDNDGYETGADCNDSSVTIYINYYLDLDGDGLGSDISICSGASTPTGYVTNSDDTNDNDYDNDGSETGTDCDDTDDAISENQTYYLDSDGDGYGDPAETALVCSYTVPDGYASSARIDVPENLVNSDKGVYKATLGWDEVSDVESYNIRYRQSSESSYASATSSSNSVELEDLQNAGKYYWQVQGVSGDYASEWTDEKRLITYPRKITKSEFTFPKSDRKAKKLRIKIETMAKRVTGFNILVYKKKSGKWSKIDTVKRSNDSSKNYVYKYLTGLKPETKYKFEVKARRTIGSTKYLSQNVAIKYITTNSL